MDTQSDENNGAQCPSSNKQFELAKYLKAELEELGLEDVELDEHAYVYATLPANTEKEVPTIGFIAHMDTSPDCSGANVKPRIIKNYDEDGVKRYDFQFENKRGYKMTIEGLSEKFNKEYWNYAKLISGVLRWRMPIEQVIKLVGSLQLDSENINTWKNGVERALKKYVQDGTEAKGVKCPNCGHETLVYQEGCLICKTCGSSRCG